MSDLKKQILIHFVIGGEGGIIKKLLYHVPRIGDEVRLIKNKRINYYIVKRIVWVYDEPGCINSRVNIEMVND